MRNNLHPKILHCLESMLLTSTVDYPYFAEFNAAVNFFERAGDPNLPTAGVNVTEQGMNHYYNPKFVDALTQKEVNFLVLHETFHLLFNHPLRTRQGGYKHSIANVAQDMIINQIIMKDIKASFVDCIKDKKTGKNTGLFIPKEYEGEWVFEILYDWLRLKSEETKKRRKKKQDEKIFNELFVLQDRPHISELSTNYNGQFSTFLNGLIDKSKTDCEKYMKNFVRRCLVSFQNMKEVTLIGHTDGFVSSTEKDPDYNLNLSIRRAELFKNAVIQNIDDYMDTYAYCIALFEHEASIMSREDKVKYILLYEEIQNPVTKKQRTVELDSAEYNTPKHNEVELLFKTYRFTELDKMDEKTLNAMCVRKNLPIPNIQQEKLHWVQTAQTMLITEGRADTEKIIINEDDNEEAIIRNDIAHLSQYKQLKFIKDSDIKREINRRVCYKFSDGGSGKSGLGGGQSPEDDNQNNRDGYGQNSHDGQDSGFLIQQKIMRDNLWMFILMILLALNSKNKWLEISKKD